MRALLLLVLMLPCRARGAETCATAEFFDRLGRPRNQDGTSWCFAHSAADLITAATGVRISAFELGLQTLAGGTEGLANTTDDAVGRYVERTHFLDRRLPAARRQRGSRAFEPGRMFDGDNGILRIGGEDDEAIIVANGRGLCRDEGIPERQWDAHMREIGALPGSPAQKVAAWTTRRCGARVPLMRPLVPRDIRAAPGVAEFRALPAARRAGAQARVWQFIDRALDEGHPVSIGYDFTDLYGRDWREDHTSVVAARKLVDGQCRYFIRDHWGPAECARFLPTLGQCEPEKGGVWVRRADLPSLYGAIDIP